jgi:hypothetical protein
MTFAEMVVAHRKKMQLSREEFAEKCSLPIELIAYLEEPEVAQEQLIIRCAAALGMKRGVFTGEEAPEPTLAEKREAAIAAARFPKMRAFFIDGYCGSAPDKAIALFGSEKVSLAERNLILHLSTTSLYQFCDHCTSSFGFDGYLFRLHDALFTRYEKQVASLAIPDEEKQDLVDTARNSVFACDTMENIAIRIAEPFADEFEAKLAKGTQEYATDLSLPFRWDFDAELMKIKVLDKSNAVIREIRLLSVDERKKG